MEEGVSGQGGIIVGQLVEVAVLIGQQQVLQGIILGHAPGLGSIGYIAIGHPLGQVQQGGIAGNFADVLPKQAGIHQYLGDAFADLPLQVGVVAVEVQDHLVVHQLREAAGIRHIGAQPDIGGLGIVITVVQHNIGTALQGRFRKAFQLYELFLCHLQHVLGQFQAAFREVDVEIGRLVKAPVVFAVLDPVLPEIHARYLRQGARSQHPTSQYQKANPPGSLYFLCEHFQPCLLVLQIKDLKVEVMRQQPFRPP